MSQVQCPYCGKWFMSEYHRYQHIKNRHSKWVSEWIPPLVEYKPQVLKVPTSWKPGPKEIGNNMLLNYPTLADSPKAPKKKQRKYTWSFTEEEK